MLTVPPGCTLFHVTHWRAGSQWIRAILTEAFGAAVVQPEYFEKQLLARPIEPGRVYVCAYLAKSEFDTLDLPADSRRFVLIRDLRDTLVSVYFSLLHSHEIANPLMEKWKSVLVRLDEEEGLLYFMEVWLNLCALIQRSWIEAGEPFVRFEDFVADAPGMLHRVLVRHWGLRAKPHYVEDLASRYSFARLSGGRLPGQEDVRSHYRKGIHGDWRRHFTPRVTSHFKALYNDALILAGYERDGAW